MIGTSTFSSCIEAAITGYDTLESFTSSCVLEEWISDSPAIMKHEPSHQVGDNLSPNNITPSHAETKKLAAVLQTVTSIVETEYARAFVNNVHIVMLKSNKSENMETRIAIVTMTPSNILSKTVKAV